MFDIPRRADFSVDVPGVLAAAQKHKSKMLFLTAPNNPDGSVMTDADVKACLELPLLVVLDEAYVEFGRQPSRIHWVKEHENLCVLRTFSKRAGLAGLRIGYGAFPLSLIQFLWRAKQPYNVSVAAEVAACAALSNKTYLEQVKDALVSERERLFKVLQGLPGLSPYPSEANFVLCRVEGHDAAQLKDRLMREEGIMVRRMGWEQLGSPLSCSRVSFRRHEGCVLTQGVVFCDAISAGAILQQAGDSCGVHQDFGGAARGHRCGREGAQETAQG